MDTVRLAVHPFRAVYDAEVDVMYLFVETPRVAETMAEDDGVIWRYEPYTGDLVGVTLEDFRSLWGHKARNLSSRLQQRMHLPIDELDAIARDMLQLAAG